MSTFCKRLNWFFIGLLLLSLMACSQHQQPKQNHSVYQVVAKTLNKQLHFNGTVQPLNESSLISPMDAVVAAMPFHYGQLVKKGDVVLTLSSTELQKQYNDSLTDYLKAKDNYAIAKAKFNGTQDLWKAGLVSKNNYLSEKSGLNTSRVTLMQASRKLTELLDKMDETESQKLTTLSLADFSKIKKILSRDHLLIQVKAPTDGILLYPPKPVMINQIESM